MSKLIHIIYLAQIRIFKETKKINEHPCIKCTSLILHGSQVLFSHYQMHEDNEKNGSNDRNTLRESTT